MHRNAPLAPEGRLRLCHRFADGRPVAAAAESMNISRQTAHEWWRRYRDEGIGGLEDRSARSRSCPHQTSARVERRIVVLRQSRRLGPARRTGPHRREGTRPDPRRWRPQETRSGRDEEPSRARLHLHPHCDRRVQPSRLQRVRRHRERDQLHCVPGPGCRLVLSPGDHDRTDPDRTLLDEWAYARLWTSDTARARALDRWLHRYNHHRHHTAIGGPPAGRVNNLAGHNT